MGFELIARAETEATLLDGRRRAEWGDWEKVTAPEGFVINKDKIIVEALVERGSENRDERVFSDFVEIIPGTGIELPRTFSVRAFARSSRGHGAGGGATTYKYTGEFVKIQ
ncbi:alkaline protease [Bacillus subtilis]|uniref:alkaline protease n=1 Tax=Bacillus subtilis TaxID=1423 RepID=UPI002DBDA90C|nr:alkaline protease [Bacillus subtilis]MEC3621521.1 alkaline protease [Bacillus subtilis]MEC3633368.1 alkaline protease [Bacillus subtilis]MEC3643886.1 alkaline protease [Bacillus subtilis]MEC3648881.1 alkaline protease [Bacillus subtilis]MEC3698963.1 alkaline protease [Bacillus subtilis]